jgi:hypothetical protein
MRWVVSVKDYKMIPGKRKFHKFPKWKKTSHGKDQSYLTSAILSEPLEERKQNHLQNHMKNDFHPNLYIHITSQFQEKEDIFTHTKV